MAAKAGVVYFLIVFAAGFALGTLRVLVVIPRLGELAAVALELPAMLAASWFAAAWVTRSFAVPARRGPRLTMGAVAFAVLMLAEFALAVFAFGRTPSAYAETFRTASGLLGLSGQILFALCPVLQISGTRSRQAFSMFRRRP